MALGFARVFVANIKRLFADVICCNRLRNANGKGGFVLMQHGNDCPFEGLA